MNTIPCPADIYDEALAACNAKRAERGMDALESLPAGFPGDPMSCPCGAATGLRVGSSVWWTGENQPHGMRFPAWFDSNACGGGLCLPIRTEGA